MKKKIPLSKFSIGMMIALGVCSIVLMITTALEQSGTRMVYTAFNLMGCGVMIMGLLVWALGLIFIRLKKRTTKLVVGTLLGFVLMIIGVFIFTFLGMFAQYALPQKFGTIESPEGKKVVMMYMEDTGLSSAEEFDAMLARMDARAEYIESKAAETAEVAPEATETTETAEVTEESAGYPEEARGLVFSAFPMKMGFFFDAEAEIEGAIYRGVASEAKILYEWIDENTVRFYLENAEPGDEGEFILHM